MDTKSYECNIISNKSKFIEQLHKHSIDAIYNNLKQKHLIIAPHLYVNRIHLCLSSNSKSFGYLVITKEAKMAKIFLWTGAIQSEYVLIVKFHD